MRALHWVSLAVLAFAIAMFARYLLQRQEADSLRIEIASLEHENRRLADLRTEHDRLLATKVSDSELERLRNDRAALGRLRAEINKLNESADRKARAVQEPASEKQPALVLKLAIANDGGLLLDGVPADQNGIRQLFTQLARKSEEVDIRLRVDPNETRVALIKTTMEGIVTMGKEAGLRMSLRFEKPGQVR
jgi:hypothetical protein